MEVDEMANEVNDLCGKFPAYSNLMSSFHTREFLENKCLDYNGILQRHFSDYKKDAKLSKVLANLIPDRSFKDAVANLLQNRKVKATIAVSIDPYDYLTMSVNKYGWDSCQAIGDGSYSTGAGSAMLDESTLIAYKYYGTDASYRIHKLSFEGNSKSWRQCIYFDKDTSSFVTSRQYPSTSEIITKEVRALLEGYVSKYLGRDNSWMVTGSSDVNYKEGSQCIYHDLTNGHSGKVAYLKGAVKETRVVVGANIYCPHCGEEISEARGTFLCGECRSDFR
jgi:hypothetical protein